MGEGHHETDSFYRRQALLVAAISLLPAWFLWAGEWTPFQVAGYYWLEIVAAGLFALIRTLLAAFGRFAAHDWKGLAGSIATAVFFPVHFGFFIIMICFLVGGFLPEGTPGRKLDSPMVPFEMVAENINLITLLPLFLLWEAVYFLRESIHTQHQPRFTPREPVTSAYLRLFGLFASAFAGILFVGGTDSRTAGAALMIAFRFLCALAVLWHERTKEMQPAATSG